MKKVLLFTLLSLLCATGWWSCNDAATETASSKTEKTMVTGAPLPAFQVSADSAQTWMTRWAAERSDMIQALANSPVASDTSFLVYGFHVPRLELDSMLAYLGPDPNVWAMLAIKYDSASQTFVPELVFAAEPAGGKKEPWSYYDFTTPCPTYCPNAQETYGSGK